MYHVNWTEEKKIQQQTLLSLSPLSPAMNNSEKNTPPPFFPSVNDEKENPQDHMLEFLKFFPVSFFPSHMKDAKHTQTQDRNHYHQKNKNTN